MDSFLGANGIVTILVTVFFIGVSVFTVYETLKRFDRYRKTREEFKSTHLEHEDIDYSRWPVISMFLLAILILIICGLTFWSGIDSMYTIVYICLGILFLALAMDNRIRYQCSVTKDGFFYEDKFYRYKSLKEVQFKEGLFKKSFLVISAGREEIPCTYKIGKVIQEHQVKWKKNKKRK